MDNIYVLNYLINKGGKLIILFVDLKATFDLVEVLIKTKEEKTGGGDIKENEVKSESEGEIEEGFEQLRNKAKE